MEPWITLAERCRLHRISSAEFHRLLQQPWPYEELGAASVTFDAAEVIEDILAHKHVNRTIGPANHARLQEAMREGGWVDETGETIIFSSEMRLADGEHRLLTALETGTAIQSVVVWGVPVEKRSAMNIGDKRSGADMLAISGVPDATNLASALRVLSRLETGTMTTLAKVVQNHGIVAYYHDRKTIYYSLTYGRKVDQFVPQSIATALHYQFKHRDDSLANQFFLQLATGEQLAARDPVNVLRNVLISQTIRDPRRKKQWTAIQQAARAAQIIIGWNAVRQGKSLYTTSLNWNAEKEAFPEIV